MFGIAQAFVYRAPKQPTKWAPTMSIDGDAVLRYAKADQELDEKARAMLTQIVREIEDHYGIRIAEFRVTIDPSHRGNGWPSVNCVIVREQQGAH